MVDRSIPRPDRRWAIGAAGLIALSPATRRLASPAAESIFSFDTPIIKTIRIFEQAGRKTVRTPECSPWAAAVPPGFYAENQRKKPRSPTFAKRRGRPMARDSSRKTVLVDRKAAGIYFSTEDRRPCPRQQCQRVDRRRCRSGSEKTGSAGKRNSCARF